MRRLEAGAATLTIVFTDLVSSTELRSRLGDEVADRLRREHDDLVTSAVETNDGIVVKGLGDGMMAAFEAPSRAIGAAVSIQQVIDQRNAGAQVPLALRVGVSAGEVRIEAGDVFGTAVVEAARLCGAAEAHQILAAEVVLTLAGSRATASSSPLGELDLKGLGRPVPTVDVAWAGPGDGRAVAFPEIPTFHRASRPVGMRLELAAAQQALLGALGGRSGLVAVRGVAGCGKTRFAGEMVRRAAKDGVLVLYGRSDASLVPHAPVVGCLEHVLASLPPERAIEGLGAEHGALARLFPALEGLLGDGDVEGERPGPTELGEAVGAWLTELAGPTGAIVVLDDLHQADADTLELVAGMICHPGSARVLVVAVAQRDPGAADPLAGLVESVRAAEHPVEELELGALDQAGVEDVLDRLSVPAGPDRLATAATLSLASGGSPLYVTELVHLLRTSGWLVRNPDGPDGGQATALAGAVPSDAVPVGLDVLRTRLDALDPAARRVLQAAALAGLSVDVDVLAQATEVDAGTVLAVLERTDAQHLTVRSPETRRRRSLAHDAYRWLLESEVGDRAVVIHARLAGVYEERLALGDATAVFPLARHRLAAGSGDRSTLEVVVQAARACERMLAPTLAASWYAHAVAIASSLHGRGEVTGAIDPDELRTDERRCRTLGSRPA